MLIFLLLIVIGTFLYYLLFKTHSLSLRLARIKTARRWLLSLSDWVEDFAGQTASIRQKRGEWILQFVLALLIWAIFPLKLILLIFPHNNSIPLLVLFGTTFVSYFAGMIPLLPGGLGTFETTMSGLLTIYGLPLNQAVAITIVFRFITFWFVLLLSLLLIGSERIILLAQRRSTDVSRQ
ncbi:MAG: flippase-like domain-containing protein [Firmicutes bacterium]|nr:flippase-like domain-containing protein [Bacillota bacterium]